MDESKIYVLYGSATGNSQHIAQSLHTSLSLSTPCVELNKWKDTSLSSDASSSGPGVRLLIVCSTTGNGDSPENAGRFVRFVKRKTNHTSKPFPKLTYAVLALGDTNYSEFCACGCLIDKHLTNCGGTRFKSITMADEAVGLEEVVEGWVEDVKKYLTEGPGGDESSPTSGDDESSSPSTHPPPPADPLVCLGISLLQSILPKYSDKVISEDEIGSLMSASSSFVNPALNLPPKVPDLNSLLGTSLKSANDSWTHTSGDSATNYTADKPFPSTITSCRYLSGSVLSSLKVTAEQALGMPIHERIEALKGLGRRVVELEVTLPDDFSLEYSPGDAIGIIIPPSPDLVGHVMERCKFEEEYCGNDGVKKGTREAVGGLDITRVVKKRQLVGLADSATKKEERNCLRFLASKKSSDAFDSFVTDKSVNLVDLLRLFPSLSPSLPLLLSLYSSVPPRYYSVTSSPLYHPHRVKFAFTVVDYEAVVGSGRRLGLTTGYMEANVLPILMGGKGGSDKIEIFPKPSKEFRLPASSRFPLVLIGPGTGVAPFIGFVEHRKLARQASVETTAESCAGMWRGGFELESGDIGVGRGDTTDFCSSEKAGPVHLFFGCRDEGEWIYRREMEEMKAKGDIEGLHVAFSRKEEGKKAYVQDLMVGEGIREELADLVLKREGYVFICGDGTKMAKDVMKCLEDILGKENVASLKDRKKIVCDIWSG